MRRQGIEKGAVMKKLMIATLLAGQLLAAAPPAAAAELDRHAAPQVGAFGGLRVRLPLDGDRRDRQLRAGLAVAPTVHSRTADGETRLRIGEGIEFGVRGRAPAQLSLAGQGVRRLNAQGEEDEDSGVPTWAIVAGAVVVVLGAGLVAFTAAMNASSE
jgi:hypothetical protein